MDKVEDCKIIAVFKTSGKHHLLNKTVKGLTIGNWKPVLEDNYRPLWLKAKNSTVDLASGNWSKKGNFIVQSVPSRKSNF